MVTSQDSKLMKGKLIKMKSLKESLAIEVGETLVGHYFHKPTPGEGFIFFPSEKPIVPFQTSTVKKIIDEVTFETKNSVYKLLSKSDERDIAIENILK